MPASCGTRTAVAQLKASTFQVFLELHFFLFRARKLVFCYTSPLLNLDAICITNASRGAAILGHIMRFTFSF